MCDVVALTRNEQRRTAAEWKKDHWVSPFAGIINILSLSTLVVSGLALLALIEKKMPKKSRRRTSREIGLGSAAIAQYDREQDCQQAYQELRAQAAARPYNNFSALPSFDELQRNFKISQKPDAWGNNILRLDESDGRWKFVIAVENLHPTFVGNMVQLQQERDSLTFVEFKQYMKRKYAVDDELLDLFVDKSDKKESKAKGTPIAEDSK